MLCLTGTHTAPILQQPMSHGRSAEILNNFLGSLFICQCFRIILSWSKKYVSQVKTSVKHLSAGTMFPLYQILWFTKSSMLMTIIVIITRQEEALSISIWKAFGSGMLRTKKMQRKKRYDGDGFVCRACPDASDWICWFLRMEVAV